MTAENRLRLPYWWRVSWPFLWFLVLTILWTWPLAMEMTTVLPGSGADPLLQTWILAWDGHALLHHPASVWDAPIFFPYPRTLTYNDHHLLWAVVMLPVLAFGQPVAAYNALLLLSFTLSGWAVFLLSRDILAEHTEAPAATIGALLAGGLFAFSTYRMAHLAHLNLLHTAWLPLALYWLRQMAVRSGGAFWRAAALTGVFAGVQAATAIYYAPMVALAVGVAAFVWLWPVRWRSPLARRAVGRSIGGLALAGAVAALIALPLLLPYMTVYAYLGIVRSLGELVRWSAPLTAYLSVPAGNVLYGAGVTPVQPGSEQELLLFPGALSVVLAGIGGWRWWRVARRDGLALLLIGAVGVVLSLGVALRVRGDEAGVVAALPYGWLYERVPGFNALRVPARWWMLGSLAVAVLAGMGAAWLWRGWGRWLVPVVGALALLEHLVWPIPRIELPAPPPVYQWLAQSSPSAHRVVLELPIDAKLRSERITWRQFFQISHWRSLPIGYSGLFPNGSLELARRVQLLPDNDTVRYLATLGIDTLIIHRNDFSDPTKAAHLITWADQTPLLERTAAIGEAVVYTLKSQPVMPEDIAGATVYLSANERIPGLVVLGLARRWREAGAVLYGSARIRYYPAWETPQPGQVFDYVMLARSEDPSSFGVGEREARWQGEGIVLYEVPDILLTSFTPGVPDIGQFHPRHPATLTVRLRGDSVEVGRSRIVLPTVVESATLLLDVASLTEQEVQVGETKQRLAAGGQTLTVPISRDQPVTISGDAATFSIVRVQLWRGTPALDAVGGVALTVESTFAGSRLQITAQYSGNTPLLLEIHGAEAGTERPVMLARGTLPVSAAGAVDVTIDARQPQAAWLSPSRAAVDGRYIAYVKLSPDTDGLPIAQFQVRNGELVAAQAVPLPLTILR
ncbi:hypothetical protein [Chloroflexus sp.]|uniref:hypothetical protein n=1 Tax=Chloroflexus sp. TaxID=1904827 RepID=UPI002ACDC87A|nr:hypothetical protein [Chloroflexus sp.]